MKLLARESNKIKEVLEEKYGLKDSYTLVKKKGWVYIDVKGHKFAFHRKDISTILDGKLVVQNQYYIKLPDKQKPVEGLNQVLVEISKWIDCMP